MNWSFTTIGDWLARWLPQVQSPAFTASELSRLNVADELAAAGRVTESIAIYASLLRTNPDLIEGYINSGSLCIDLGEYEAAIGLLRAGLEKAPLNTHLWANLSAALSSIGQHEAALEAANNAIRYNSNANNAMAYYNRAECWAALNQMIFAIRDLETANVIDPANQEIAKKLWLCRLAIAPPLQQYEDAQYEPKAHGYELVDGVEVRATLQCPHCGSHFPSVKGSGKTRGWCGHCWDVTCGKPECVPCVPFKKKLEVFDNESSARIG